MADKLKDLDIAMLYLNAGVSIKGCFLDLTYDETERMMNINGLQPMYLAKTLLNKQLSRGKRSAIVVTSSIAALQPLAGRVVYCAVKSLVTYLSNALFYEVGDKIDVLSYNPGFV